MGVHTVARRNFWLGTAVLVFFTGYSVFDWLVDREWRSSFCEGYEPSWYWVRLDDDTHGPVGMSMKE